MNNTIVAHPSMPCLKEGEAVYTLTPYELSTLLNTAYRQGYEFARDIYKASLDDIPQAMLKEEADNGEG